MNYTNKELVRSFDWSDFRDSREINKKVIINGRTYYKMGIHTATSVVGDLYKLNDPSEKQFNYVLMLGVARQHPCDTKITYEKGIEIAAINAKIDPVAVIRFPEAIDWNTFRYLAMTYSEALTPELIKTKAEIKAAGLDPEKYSR